MPESADNVQATGNHVLEVEARLNGLERIWR